MLIPIEQEQWNNHGIVWVLLHTSGARYNNRGYNMNGTVILSSYNHASQNKVHLKDINITKLL